MGCDNNVNYTFQIENEDGSRETISLGETQEIEFAKLSEGTIELKDTTVEMTFVLPKKLRGKAKRIIKKQQKLLKKLGELEPKWLSLFTLNDIKSTEKGENNGEDTKRH